MRGKSLYATLNLSDALCFYVLVRCGDISRDGYVCCVWGQCQYFIAPVKIDNLVVHARYELPGELFTIIFVCIPCAYFQIDYMHVVFWLLFINMFKILNNCCCCCF